MMIRRSILLTISVTLSIPVIGQFTTTAEVVKQHVYTLAADSLLGRGFGTVQGVSAAHYIASQFREAGIEPLHGEYLHRFNHREGILNISGLNVLGVIPGNDPLLQEEYIILGAHFDHIGWKPGNGDTIVYNGADDNASGVAAIIEIGRNLVGQKELIGRSIILAAFDGEESGLLGSKAFLNETPVQHDKIIMMFGLDMVGMYDAHEGLDLRGIELLADYDTQFNDAATTYDIIIKKTGKRVEQRTDTAPFGDLGIVAIHVFTGTESPYHQPGDIADSLDYEGLARITNFLSAATLNLSSDNTVSERIEFRLSQGIPSWKKKFRTGIRLNMGSGQHDYMEEFYIGKSVLASEVGLFASIRAAEFLTIQPEILYETKGSKHQEGTFRTHSLTLPLNLLLTSPDYNQQGIRVFFQLGGYYSHHFGGKAGNTKIDFQNEYSVNEYGLAYGIGMEVMQVQFGLYIQKGLSGLLQNRDDGIIINENSYFQIGYTF